MLEKGNVFRKLLCLWGWHHWLKHENVVEDRSYRLVLPLVCFAIPGFVLLVNSFVAPPEKHLIASTIYVLWILLIGSIVFLPKAATLARGAFDGICIFCHKKVDFLSQERKKVADDKQYIALLEEVAKETCEKDESKSDELV
jgi:hypothetical protein